MKLLFPDASLRSPTAVPGRSDMRDENIYSSLVLTNAGTGNTTVFSVPRGQAIPKIGALAVAAHQATYTELTTNISQAGQFGSALGDVSLRGIGINIEQAWVVAATGVINTFGAGQREMCEISSKCFFQLRIGGKLQIQGPVTYFPASGALAGSLASTANAMTVGLLNNGIPGTMRRLKIPVLVARTDTVEGTFGVGGGATLSFTGDQPTLVWVNCHALIKGDAR